jgi:hypothetical protein
MSNSAKLGKFKEVKYPGDSPGIDWLNTLAKYMVGFSILLILSFVVIVVNSFHLLFNPLKANVEESLHKVWRPVLKGESLAHIFFWKGRPRLRQAGPRSARQKG